MVYAPSSPRMPFFPKLMGRRGLGSACASREEGFLAEWGQCVWNLLTAHGLGVPGQQPLGKA